MLCADDHTLLPGRGLLEMSPTHTQLFSHSGVPPACAVLSFLVVLLWVGQGRKEQGEESKYNQQERPGQACCMQSGTLRNSFLSNRPR